MKAAFFLILGLSAYVSLLFLVFGLLSFGDIEGDDLDE